MLINKINIGPGILCEKALNKTFTMFLIASQVACNLPFDPCLKTCHHLSSTYKKSPFRERTLKYKHLIINVLEKPVFLAA